MRAYQSLIQDAELMAVPSQVVAEFMEQVLLYTSRHRNRMLAHDFSYSSLLQRLSAQEPRNCPLVRSPW